MMKMMKLAGLAGTVGYIGLALTAFVLYPRSFSPLHNWLSDLGNPLVNTKGAVFNKPSFISNSILIP